MHLPLLPWQLPSEDLTPPLPCIFGGPLRCLSRVSGPQFLRRLLRFPVAALQLSDRPKNKFPSDYARCDRRRRAVYRSARPVITVVVQRRAEAARRFRLVSHHGAADPARRPPPNHIGHTENYAALSRPNYPFPGRAEPAAWRAAIRAIGRPRRPTFWTFMAGAVRSPARNQHGSAGGVAPFLVDCAAIGVHGAGGAHGAAAVTRLSRSPVWSDAAIGPDGTFKRKASGRTPGSETGIGDTDRITSYHGSDAVWTTVRLHSWSMRHD